MNIRIFVSALAHGIFVKQSLTYRACDAEENGLQVDRFVTSHHPVGV